MGDLLAALRFEFMGLLRKALDAPGNGLRLAVAERFFEEENLVEEFLDGSGVVGLVFLEGVADVEELEARKHLRKESFLDWCGECFKLGIMLR